MILATQESRVFFRFIAAVVLVVLVSMCGVLIEKRMLDLRREVSRQQYQTEILLDRHTALRLRTQQLSAPGLMLESMNDADLAPRDRVVPDTRREPEKQTSKPRRSLPLLNWERPAAGGGRR